MLGVKVAGEKKKAYTPMHKYKHPHTHTHTHTLKRQTQKAVSLFYKYLSGLYFSFHSKRLISFYSVNRHRYFLY